MSFRGVRRRAWLACVLCLAAALPASAQIRFEITRADSVHPAPFTGRVYVMLGPTGSRAPKNGPNWFNPQPMFAVDVTDWAAETATTVADGPGLFAFPAPLGKLMPGKYAAQALMRINMDTHRLGNGPGNAFSEAVEIEVGPESDVVKMKITTVQPEDTFPDNPRVKLETLESPSLTAFHGRPIRHRAAVILPEGWDGKTKLPSLYIIPGFGGDHRMALRILGRGGAMSFGSDIVRIVLDPDCVTGHHVFADSATNGPRGQAFVDEFIPHLDKKYNLMADAGARFVNGHSSGGWSSLWLQVTYPKTFGGVWSTSPDPIDFRDFQRIDIYARGENMFRDREGARRPIARVGDRPVVFYDTFSQMEEVMGPGGQLYSFEAVFSPLTPEKAPAQLWNRKTGEIDLRTADAWKKYDIGLILRENWAKLGPELAGKLHIVMGDKDTFYLEGATRLVQSALKEMGSDADVQIVAGRDHSDILDRALAARIDRQIRETLIRNGIEPPVRKEGDEARAKAAD
jgi:hypothetical protein